MNDFIQFVLYELQNSFIRVAGLLVCAAAVVGFLYYTHRKKYNDEKKFPWGKAVLIVVFLAYLVVLDYATIGRSGYHGTQVNFHLFRAWRTAWNNYSVKSWLNVLLNILLFVPLGFFVPILSKRFRKWYYMLGLGFGVSLWIEGLQLLLARGICDVDDLFCNTLGTMIGCFLILAIFSITGKEKHRIRNFVLYTLSFLLPIAATGGIFIAYGLQEYGNFPDAPTYQVNTSKITWELACELPEATETVPIYYAGAFTDADCDALGAEFAHAIGADFDSVLHYENETMFIDHSAKDGAHQLTISLINRSFTYNRMRSLDESILWATADRETLEKLLSGFPVDVPDGAMFWVVGNGWHAFEADRLATPQGMYDGILKCRYSADGMIREMKSELNLYCYYKEETVISPQEAYRLLCSGHFGEAADFPTETAVMKITNCTLEYRVDTKGYYRPVYLFEVESDAEEHTARLTVYAVP